MEKWPLGLWTHSNSRLAAFQYALVMHEGISGLFEVASEVRMNIPDPSV